jgi:hypothetical protein
VMVALHNTVKQKPASLPSELLHASLAYWKALFSLVGTRATVLQLARPALCTGLERVR